MRKLLNTFTGTLKRDREIAPECAVINQKRIQYASGMAAFVHVVFVLLFLSESAHDPIHALWRQGILASHIAMFVLMSGMFILSLRFKCRSAPDSRAAGVLQYVCVIVIMSAGVIIVSIDQLVTTNITPFTIVCVVTGTVFLIRPTISFLVFALSFAAFYIAMDTISLSKAMLLSNTVNGLTSIALGYALSVILWRGNYASLMQKKHIRTQQQSLEKANSELEKMAYRDSLTGLPNRRSFDETISREIAFMQRKGHDSCLILMDIDFFKSINDAYGHPAGDLLLMQLSKLLSENIRHYDTICRLGGEEFLLLLPQTTLQDATATAENLRKLIESHNFAIGGKSVYITVSIGVAKLSTSNTDTLINQYTDVDNAMYLAKQNGRNCVKTA